MRPLVYLALVILLTAPLVWAWKRIRRWLSPELPLGTIMLRILAMSVAYLVYAWGAFWLTLKLMGLISG